MSLADLVEAQAIPDAILDALGLSRRVDSSWHAPFRAALAERSGLLILDNFEHLAEDGASYVRDLLTFLPGLVCLTTSRIRLDIAGERVFQVAPLPIPEKSESAEALSRCPSIQLFVDRAQTVQADFHLTPRNADAVAELCRRLEGLPLALELAASWAQTLTAHQMLKRLQNPLHLSTPRRREAGGRHESLRATIEWSYRLLSTEQQTLFRLLSGFRGGWNLAAAYAICANTTQEADRSLQEETLLRDLTILANRL